MKCLFVTFILIPFFVQGQKSDLYALVPQGGFYKSNEMSISWTLGELFTETVFLGNNAITQGFQQPNFDIIRLNSSDDEEMEVSLFPNPTQGWLTLKMAAVTDKYRVEIIDITGRILSVQWHKGAKVLLDISGLPSGQYVLRIVRPTTETRASFSVVKF